MIFIIHGAETYLINKKINEIIEDNKDSEISRYNGLDKSFTVNEMINACTNIGLFSSKTLVLVRDPFFFINKTNEKDAEMLLEYCNGPIYECDLVLYTLDDSFNTKLKLFKDVSVNAQVIKYDHLKPGAFNSACYEILKKRKLNFSRQIVNQLINSANNDLMVFDQDLDVLSLYPDELNSEVLEKMLISADFNNVYALINALTSKKVSLALMLTDKLLAYDDNIHGLISLLGSQLRFLYEVSYYDKHGMPVDEIMDRVHTNSRFRIDKAFEALSYLKERFGFEDLYSFLVTS